jgi:Mitochondrial sulfhydryl oxidase involved in the biogenesis of cytosolic Fe/S proteins
MVAKSVWGPAIWYLFHTLSFKIKPIHFNELKDQLLDHFVSICNNLPCPECAEHAKQELKHLDKSKITNKRELCMYFIHFHNKVNVRTKKKIFTFDEFILKYKNSVTRNVIANFFIVLSKSDHNIKLMTNSFHRSTVIVDLKKMVEYKRFKI